ncbi:phenylalanine--tRNA ligase subunit beta [Picrophilus oshimae]|uniref:phenylalanine--tRNA ligase n=1 Tax=Picrophilus torridus (strain ATCC 700027 / DSM 9790 / JCM 10055 / NBRC 100828 / KAW 2/3) TaxID=1122961 RepID=A0A8G2FVP9_PICTO|nr:phenylalanine--tRNA ligase subunit beta [Picrophilus oshimae]SMD30324.1 phenylalanyl-tRNA synthetase beta subunit [Picrophilus oshimae DSM 9789]
MVVIRADRSYLRTSFGESFIDYLNKFSDIIGFSIECDDDIKVELNPDRPDLFSFYAINNAIKTYYHNNFIVKSPFDRSNVKFTSKLNDRYIMGFTASGHRLGNLFKHIIEYQERLHETIGKNRKKMAIGIHDLDKIKPPFLLKYADDISFETYDGFKGSVNEIISGHPKGIEYGSLVKRPIVIIDDENDVLSMPPVINGKKSIVTEDTKNLFFDITGSDFNAVRSALMLFMYEMHYLNYKVSYANFPGLKGVLKYDFRPLKLNDNIIKRYLGISIGRENTIESLRRMGYRAEVSSYGYNVLVPGNRIDVMGDVDIIEDIAKAYGYNNIDENVPETSGIARHYKINDFKNIIRDIMISSGFQEIMTFVLSSNYYNNIKYDGGFKIENPKSIDFSVIRDRLYLNFLNFLNINKRNPLPQKIFEIGNVISKTEEKTHLCAMICDSETDYTSIYKILRYLSLRLSIDFHVEPMDIETLIPGRSGVIKINGVDAGIIGEMDPEIYTKFDIYNPIAFLEIDVESLI